MTVNNVNALLNYKAAQTAAQPDQAQGKQEELVKNGFDKIMTKMNDTVKSLHAAAAGNVAASRTVDTADTLKQNVTAVKTVQQTSDDTGRTEDAMQQGGNQGVRNEEVSAEAEGVAEEVEKSAEKLVQEIADEMDVTPEEVEEAMAALGLTAVQLFDVDNLKQLLLQLSGSEDELSLVTDATLYGNLQNLFTAVEETLADLQEELGMSEEELSALVEQMAAANKAADAQEAELPVEETPEVNLEGMKDYTVSVQKDGATVQVKVTVDDESGSKSVREEVTDAPKAEMQDNRRMRAREASADHGREEGRPADHTAGNPLLQTPDKPAVSEAPTPVYAGYQTPQTEDIMNQIMEYMKINVKADTQQMELQLHPASLGTVNVQIAAKDGAITAQFTTQNEAVRAVIETQLIQLKNQFEEQGIKVDAVEVTVANHAYGQQFSQDNENSDQKQGKSAKGTRRLNLDELEDGEGLEELEESERIAVEMMQANGSTVDYTA